MRRHEAAWNQAMVSPAPAGEISRVISELQDASAYSHEVATIRVKQTHSSVVFLTGEYAYKVKKPVDFGFLDYSTLERRRRYCRLEIELNRRLCPDIYLDVVPITVQGARLRMGGTHAPVEWAVRMRQMRDADMLPARLAAETIGAREIAKIAGRLADFHGKARCGPATRENDARAAIARTIEMTMRVMREAAYGTSNDENASAIRGWFDRFLRTQETLLTLRASKGRIRDCHGDLRLQNVCLDERFDGGIQVFDCIEFNDALRYIDVAADMAYLAMDLDLAGRADLRLKLIDGYVQASGDAGLPSILRFYQAYRAVVRGNIARLAAVEAEIPDSDRQRHRETAEAAYDLAHCYAARRDAPALFITVGFSGSGKSCLSRELARRLPAARISSDRIRKQMAGVAENQRLPESAYCAAARRTVYAEMFERAGEYLSRGEHVLLDATFLEPPQRQRAGALAELHGSELWTLECRCPDAVIRRRLRARAGEKNASDAGLAVYDAQRRSACPDLSSVAEGSRGGRCLPLPMEQAVADLAHAVVSRFVGGK